MGIPIYQPFFSLTFMAKRREQWLRSIAAVEVNSSSGDWYRGEISEKKIENNNLIIKATFPDLDAVECNIYAMRVIDVRGEVAARTNEHIHKNSGQGFMVKITIPIYEVAG